MIEFLQFRKSSYSAAECVEVALDDHGAVIVRNSRVPDLRTAAFTREEWRAFVSGVRDGEFDY